MNIPKTRPALLWQSSLQDIRACRAEPLQDYDIVWLWQLAQRVVSPADLGRPLPEVEEGIRRVLAARRRCSRRLLGWQCHRR